MEWNQKVLLSELLNSEKYKDAVDLMKDNAKNIDAQAVDIFISGFCLVQAELLKPILPILGSYITSEDISWIGRMRLALAIQQCKK